MSRRTKALWYASREPWVRSRKAWDLVDGDTRAGGPRVRHIGVWQRGSPREVLGA